MFLILCHYIQAVMDVLEPDVFCTWMSLCERYIPRGGIAESKGMCIFMLMDLAKLLSRTMKLFTNPPAIMRRPVSAHPTTNDSLSNHLKDEKRSFTGRTLKN